MSGTIKPDVGVQVGISATATQNLTIRTNKDGTFTFARGNVGATTQDILTIDANGKVATPQGPAARTDTVSMVRLHTANGYGSAATRVRRFSTVVSNVGTEITYADSATDGATFTINTSGVYAATFTDNQSASDGVGITLNDSVTAAAPLIAETLSMNVTPAANTTGSTSWCGYLAAGSVIRARTFNGSAAGTAFCAFTITRVS